MNPSYPLMFLAVFLFALNSCLTRLFQVKQQKKAEGLFLYQACFCLTASVLFLCIGRQLAKPLLPAVLFGLFFAAAIFCSAKCCEIGSMSLTSIIINLSLLVPLLYSWFFLNESVLPRSIIGCVLLSATFVLSSGASRKERYSNWWLLLVVIGFAANGTTAVVQKQQQLLQANSGAFLGTAYLVSAIVIAILFFVKKGNQQTTHFVQSLPKTVAYSLLSGFGSFAGNGLLMYLSTKINGGVLYPVINGGLCLVCSAVSFLVFREKPTRQKAAAILTGLAAIVLLCL